MVDAVGVGGGPCVASKSVVYTLSLPRISIS